MRLLPTEHHQHAATRSSVLLSVTCCGPITYDTPHSGEPNISKETFAINLYCLSCFTQCHVEDYLTLTKQSCGVSKTKLLLSMAGCVNIISFFVDKILDINVVT